MNKDADAFATQATDSRKSISRQHYEVSDNCKYLLGHYDGGYREKRERGHHGSAGFIVRGARQFSLDSTPDFFDVLKCSFYMPHAQDSLEAEVTAITLCSMAVITLQVFGMYELKPDVLQPKNDFEMSIRRCLIRTFEVVKDKVKIDNNLGD